MAKKKDRNPALLKTHEAGPRPRLHTVGGKWTFLWHCSLAFVFVPCSPVHVWIEPKCYLECHLRTAHDSISRTRAECETCLLVLATLSLKFPCLCKNTPSLRSCVLCWPTQQWWDSSFLASKHGQLNWFLDQKAEQTALPRWFITICLNPPCPGTAR